MTVTTTLDAADKVNVEDDERLDIPDFRALQELLSEYLVRMLGGLFGGARRAGASSAVTVSGCLNTINFNASTLSATTFGTTRQLLLNFRQNSIGDDEGQVVWYDPADPGQQTTIDLSSFQADSLTPYIWAKRFDIPDDADTRRKWVSPAEVVVSLATRQRHRVELAANVGDHRVTAADDQWFIIAQIESWTIPVTGSPIFRTWHPFDAGLSPTTGVANSWTEARSLGFSAYDVSSLGINQAMHLLLTQLMRHRKADGTVHPLTSNPEVGLDDLKDITDGLSDLNDDLAVNAVGVVRLISNGAGVWTVIGSPKNYTGPPTVASSGWKMTLTFDTPFTTVVGAQVTVGALKDVYAQISLIAGKDVSIDLQTMVNLIAQAHDWTVVPGGSPPVNTTLDILAVQ